MPTLREIPRASAHLLDTEGFEMEAYCGVFVLEHREGAALVETGPSSTTETVLSGLDELGIEPERVTHILPTHIHLDHAGATWRLLEACPNATAYIHENGFPFVTQAKLVDKLLASVEDAVGSDRFPLYGTFEPLDPTRVVSVTAGLEVEVGGRWLDLVDAPGHAPHQYAVVDRASDIAFVGDAAGIKQPDGPLLMTTPPPRFDLEAWRGTLDMLELVDVNRLALTHFGVVDKDEHLDAFASALASWVREIADHRDAGRSFDETVQALEKSHPEGRQVYDEMQFHEELRMNARGVWDWLAHQEA